MILVQKYKITRTAKKLYFFKKLIFLYKNIIY